MSFLSSHPKTKERVSYLETVIKRNKYNRYAYEGVGHHGKMQERLEKLLEEAKIKRRRRGRF